MRSILAGLLIENFVFIASLDTPWRKAVINTIGGGQYWHQGVEFGLRLAFKGLREPTAIELNINVDGLPISESGNDQFWPILYNIHGMAHIKPMVAGMFYGKTKPSKIEEFLDPFVHEIEPILTDGISINGHRLSVRIRAFICDSPARAFVKGTAFCSFDFVICVNDEMLLF